MSSVEKYQPHYTVDDYRRWEGDWELWEGTPVSMTPSPFGRHASITGRVATAFNNAIDAAECAATVLVEIDWIVSKDTVLRPDVTVICGPAPDGHVESLPAVVIEVLSPATRERDKTFKKNLYAREGVPWYLILDPDDSTTTALKHQGEEMYEAVTTGETLEMDICHDCRLSVKLDRLFI